MLALGMLMLAAPFLGIFLVVAYVDGWEDAISVFGVTAVLITWIHISVWLIETAS